MADEQQLQAAAENFHMLCAALDEENWHYSKDEKAFSIQCGAKGDDLPMELKILMLPESSTAILLSQLPFKIAKDKRIDAAVAVCAINDLLVDGCFDYNIKDGTLLFRLSAGFLGRTLSKEYFHYMLLCSCNTIDEYNDKLLGLSKGFLHLQDFLKEVG